MSRAKVAVLRTSPESVVEDYGKLLRLAEYEKYLSKEKMTCLKINVSWQIFFPACSSVGIFFIPAVQRHPGSWTV